MGEGQSEGAGLYYPLRGRHSTGGAASGEGGMKRRLRKPGMILGEGCKLIENMERSRRKCQSMMMEPP